MVVNQDLLNKAKDPKQDLGQRLEAMRQFFDLLIPSPVQLSHDTKTKDK